jgi:hypothetical protein
MKTIAEIEYEKWSKELKINDPIIRMAFIEAYNKGKNDKIKYTFEEQMQK